MAVADRIAAFMERASWIRRMFEEGAALKAEYGAENVYDFTLGNPDVPAPPQVDRVLGELCAESIAMKHGYMPNAGYMETRARVAERVSGEQGVSVPPDAVVMTCGAGGALNVVFKTLLNPGEEVVTPRPYFVEYDFYVDNHGGVLRTAPATAAFGLDTSAIARALTDKTRAVLINSPNNPTGAVYGEEELRALGKVLAERSAALGRAITLVVDEPYRAIVYDGARTAPVFPAYKDSIVVNSYSKELSLAGERIGFLAVNPRAGSFAQLMQGLVFSNRVLGFVNAPGLMQRLIARLGAVRVDVDVYRAKRDVLWEGLTRAGFSAARPKGAFYLFPRSPLEDDVAFVRELQKMRILAVPGCGFGAPGYFRLAYCVSDATLEGALPVFAEAGARFCR